MTPPVLSVCIPTHHGRGPLLEAALESIALQVTSAVELVVSDNASQDGTDEMIERYRARHPHVAVVYERNERDVRLENILRVVERASGDWCWLFGSDDIMAEDGIATVLSAIERHPTVTGIAVAKTNYNQDLSVLLGQDPPAFFPDMRTETVYRGFETVVFQLAFQLAYLSTSVVRRSRWLSAARQAEPDLVARYPDWPQLVVLGEMVRRDPAWAWVPDVLVKARAGRPYLVDPDAPEANLAQVHAVLMNGLRTVWPRVVGSGTPLHRALLRKSYAVAASDDVVRNIKLQDGHTLARDLLLLRDFTRAFWRVPEFRRRALPLLLVPAAVGRVQRGVRRRTTSMLRLDAREMATEVHAKLTETPCVRRTMAVRCSVTNRGTSELRYADPYPVALGFRWFRAATPDAVLDSDRCQLTRPLRPGATVQLEARINAPWDPGDYELRIAPVQEHVAWFDDVDAANGARLAVTLA